MYTLRGVWSGIIKDDAESIKIYKKLGLPIFETKKNATEKKPNK